MNYPNPDGENLLSIYWRRFLAAVAIPDLVEVRKMSSDPDEMFVFNVTDFNALQKITDYIVKNTCHASKQVVLV